MNAKRYDNKNVLIYCNCWPLKGLNWFLKVGRVLPDRLLLSRAFKEFLGKGK